MTSVRPSRPQDLAAVDRVHRAAFPQPAEAELVRMLIEADLDRVSLVAEVDGVVAGHILFSPITIPAMPEVTTGLGLAPLAVHPDEQAHGVGSRLARDGLREAAAAGFGFVVVLGSPAYYSRFGFAPAASRGLRCIYTEGDEFMALELQRGSLDGVHGLIRYAPPFDLLEE